MGASGSPHPLLWCLQDAEGCPIDIKVKDNGDGTYHCVYVPTKAIKHTIIITWGGVTTPRSPFRVGAMGVPWGAGHRDWGLWGDGEGLGCQGRNKGPWGDGDGVPGWAWGSLGWWGWRQGATGGDRGPMG